MGFPIKGGSGSIVCVLENTGPDYALPDSVWTQTEWDFVREDDTGIANIGGNGVIIKVTGRYTVGLVLALRGGSNNDPQDDWRLVLDGTPQVVDSGGKLGLRTDDTRLYRWWNKYPLTAGQVLTAELRLTDSDGSARSNSGSSLMVARI